MLFRSTEGIILQAGHRGHRRPGRGHRRDHPSGRPHGPQKARKGPQKGSSFKQATGATEGPERAEDEAELQRGHRGPQKNHKNNHRKGGVKIMKEPLYCVHGQKVCVMVQDTKRGCKWIYIPACKWWKMTEQEKERYLI